MKEEIRCKLLELENKKHISEEEMKKILDIVKMELSFMVRNNIPPLPKWYKRWFVIFCYLYENNRQLDDLEIKGLYKTCYSDCEENISIVNVNNFSEKIEKTLKEIINSIEDYQKNLNLHKEKIEEKAKEVKDDLIIEYLQKVIKELEKLEEKNEAQKELLEKYHKEIVFLRKELDITKKEADIDFLTGVPNRRKFSRALDDFLNDLKNRNYPFSLIILDVDNFKSINDTYGHLIGDKVLKEIASILKIYLRANTIVGRLGGEEFGIIVPGVSIKDAKNIAERLRKIIENRKIRFDNKTIDFTASFGVTEARKDDNIETIIDRADRAMYEAKKNGKNKVVVIP